MAGLLSLPKASDLWEKLAKVTLCPLDENDDPITSSGGLISMVLQYWPETLEDNRSLSWQSKEVWGLSHPLYQGPASGERTISFNVYFSCDANPGTMAVPTFGGGDQNSNVDVMAAIAALRNFTFPVIKGEIIYSQPKILVSFGNHVLSPATALGSTNGSFFGILTQCDVSWISWFPDGTPRLAQVNLAFNEIIQVGGQIVSHNADLTASLVQKYKVNADQKTGLFG